MRRALTILALTITSCAPAAASYETAAVAPTTSSSTTTTTTAPAPPPPPSHCDDYANMEAGRGHPVNQHWFNHLDARGYARVRIACTRGWGTAEWECLDRLWTHESGWNHRQWNRAGSGAYGIPQSLPASKMGSHGSDYMTNPRVQVRWGIDYIAAEYRRPTGTGCRGPY